MLKVLIVMTLVVGAVSTGIFVFLPPGSVWYVNLLMAPPFEHEQGFAYKFGAPPLTSDSTDRPDASPVKILEGDKDLGPPHTLHDIIRMTGKGGFSHWGSVVYFSASDNSDPNTNGRNYYLSYPRKLPVGFYLMGLLMIFILLALIAGLVYTTLVSSRSPKAKPLSAIAIIAINILGVLVLLEASCWILTVDLITFASPMVKSYYNLVFEKRAFRNISGATFYFKEHHSLNYALNPAAEYGGKKQFNGDYLIRRTEPLTARTGVKWRALVLGGSTTFGEMLFDEEETWVFQLEERIRSVCGKRYDVVNGGVGGYTISENFRHFIELLSSLDPDLIILLVGINDVSPRLVGDLRPDYSNYWLPWRSSKPALPPPVDLLRTFWCYRYYYLITQIVNYKSNHILGVAAANLPPLVEWSSALKRNSASVYRMKLEMFVQLALEQRRQVVILAQYFAARSESDRIFAEAVAEHNTVNAEVASRYHVPFLNESVFSSAFNADDTFDNCHFTKQGSNKIAGLVYDFLNRASLIPCLAN